MSTTPSPAGPHGGDVDLAVRGTAVLPGGLVPDALVLVAGGAIRWSGPAASAPEHRAASTIAHEGLILPGLVDLHCHGGGGASFPDSAGPEEMLTAVHEHRRHGTTSLVASLVTASADTLRARVRDLALLAAAGEIVGIHSEGPFVSVERRGAQNAEHIVDGEPHLVAELAELGPRAVVVTGSDLALDVLHDRGSTTELHGEPVATRNNHGSGCTFSSAIAVRLAAGDTVPDAVAAAKRYVRRGLLGGSSWRLGSGPGPLNHFA